MSKPHRLRLLLIATALPLVGHAFTINIDYSLDSTGFFSTNSAAQDSLNHAASTLSSLITSPLAAVTQDTFTGTSGGGTSAVFNWGVSYINPSTGATISLPTFNFAADTYTVFAGARSLSANTLGLGGTAGGSFTIGGGGFPNNWQAAVTDAQNQSNAALLRGDSSPVISGSSGSVSLGGTPASYDLGIGLTVGTIAFNSTFGAWHFDHTTAVGSGMADFYSVSLHELMHTLGVGASSSFTDLVSGQNWLGGQGITIAGSGTGLISADGAHLSEGTMSTSLLTGLAQEASMDPSLILGTRKELTLLDAALLQDIGYTVNASAIPEPATYAIFGGGLALCIAVCRRRKAQA